MGDCHGEVLAYQQLITMIIVIFVVLMLVVVFITWRAGRSRKQIAIGLEQLVQERTIELKRFVESLQRSQVERSFVLDGMSKRINACLATMKGLSAIALTYENVPPELVKNIDVTADILADLLQQIALEKKL